VDKTPASHRIRFAERCGCKMPRAPYGAAPAARAQLANPSLRRNGLGKRGSVSEGLGAAAELEPGGAGVHPAARKRRMRGLQAM
jgi:hypothetical protein